MASDLEVAFLTSFLPRLVIFFVIPSVDVLDFALTDADRLPSDVVDLVALDLTDTEADLLFVEEGFFARFLPTPNEAALFRNEAAVDSVGESLGDDVPSTRTNCLTYSRVVTGSVSSSSSASFP